MTLRARLALLYTFFVGGILLLFGTAVYMAVSFTLTNQVDDRLSRSANLIYRTIRYTNGELDVSGLPMLDLPREIFVQVWGRDNRLRFASQNISGFLRPLDTIGISAAEPVFRHVDLGDGAPFRVFTVPLQTISGRPAAVLQVASSLAIVDAAQETLVRVLVIGLALSMVAAGLAGWGSTQYALRPLDAVTQTALQITRADDLSRRIPYDGPPGDEVGQLITAFNQTLGRLENLFETQRRFIADVGHELRTPLTVIKGNIDLMRRMNCADDESLDSVENEADRLARLVGDLLLLAQAEAGKLPLASRLVELDTLVLEVMQQMRVLARDRLELRLEEIDQVLVCGDQDRLKQVLVNLVGNAISYTPQGGQVIIGLGKDEKNARLTVSDTGPGIPTEDLPHIFERFYRAEKSRTRSREGKGFGLGLSIAYWIVRNHGGQIEVSNRQPHGATFTVWLPLAEDGHCPETLES